MVEQGTAKILVVDDDPSIVKLLRVILSAGGFEVLKAFNGEQGIEIAEEETPDIILLDIMMPDIDGFETFRRLRADPRTMDIPVLFISAKTDIDFVDRALALGAAGYITKPFRAPSLLEEVEKAVEERAS